MKFLQRILVLSFTIGFPEQITISNFLLIMSPITFISLRFNFLKLLGSLNYKLSVFYLKN